jgi:hypothetical protein
MSADAEFTIVPVLPLVPAPPSVAGAVSRSHHRIWPVVGLAFAVIVNMAWIVFLGFEFYKLVEPAFFF